MEKHGFRLVREENLRETGGAARLWKHVATGAELLSICNGDENKSFGVSFRTPPRDSTGVAHILEHSVLCGSQKYPVKEPFAELLKSSLQTFLNAMTYPDKTCYPVASCNLSDFYNLIDVYLDAVFHPRIDENVLRQEGWHIEPVDGGKWQYKGVVYNEMKGVYSSPESVLQEQCQHAVFPDTLYSLDSGGDPEKIPELTFRQFRAFHEAYYHPSNARFFFWGDDPEDARLARLEKELAPYAYRKVDSSVPLQPRFTAPRRVDAAYAASGQGGEKPHAAVNWLLCETRETEEMLVLDMLEHIVAGLPGSPLRKALLDSGLGEDIAGCGLESELRQAYFSMGLLSVCKEDAPAMERLMLDTLAGLAEEGVPGQAVQAALNTLEFALRENNTGSLPRGLAAMLASLSDWLYDGDPLAPLAWEKPLASVKARLASGEKVFENAIRRWFLENPHRVLVVVSPEEGLAEARQEAESSRLEALRGSMGPAEREGVEEAAALLHEAQQRPDSQEALSTVPSLGRADMPPENIIIPSRLSRETGVTVLAHELDTTGIVYARLAFGLSSVPARLLPLLPLYARALTEMGTKRRSFVDLGFDIAARTGGLGASPMVFTRLSDGSPIPLLMVSSKCTAGNIGGMAGLMEEILCEPDFSDRERFLQMVLEEKARMEQSVVPAGNALVRLRLGGRLSQAGCMSEVMGGVSALAWLRTLPERIEKDWSSVLADLEELHSIAVRGEGAVVDLTADAGLLGKSEPALSGIVLRLPGGKLPPAELALPHPSRGELLSAPSQVNYVGLGMKLGGAGYAYSGSHAVVLRHLRMGYLWDRVRVQGGAYGCSASYSRSTGDFIFVSYRDPNVRRTLEAYQGAAGYLSGLRLSEADITRAVVGAIGDMDHYMLPGAKGAAGFARWLSGESDEERQRIREEMLGTGLRDFHDFAPHLDHALQGAFPCVLGGADAAAVAAGEGWTETAVL